MFYKPLTKDNVTHIIDLMVADLNRRLEDKAAHRGPHPAAKDEIIASAYDPIYGARPLPRYPPHTVGPPLNTKTTSPPRGAPPPPPHGDRRGTPPPVDSREVLTGEVIDA